MNKEILHRMPEWYRILRQAVAEYPENQENPPHHNQEKKGGNAE